MADRGDIFSRLGALVRNLWWTWHPPARRLFEAIDPVLWRATGHNPVGVLGLLDPCRRAALARDPVFASALALAESDLRDYLRAPGWFGRRTGRRRGGSRLRVAYFCMEYGIHESLPLYAGGLGILAGDHLKSASDLGVPLVGVGILWRCGYYRQQLDSRGRTRVLYPGSDFTQLPIRDTGKAIIVPIGRARARARIWCASVGRVPLYLLDTDIPANSRRDRALTRHLYAGGDPALRIRQEILLAIGGLLALDALRVRPNVYHLNEGHAAFLPLERLRRLVSRGVPFYEAVRRVRGSSVFTTHTPVAAGNDRFDAALVLKHLAQMPRDLGLSREEFLALGREDPADRAEPFCMTVLALKLSERCNAVSELHADTSRRMWMKVYAAERPAGVPITHITNGVHPESWLADEARAFYDLNLRPPNRGGRAGAGPMDDWWKSAARLPPGDLWSLRQALRRAMIAELRLRLREQLLAVEPGASTGRLAELCGTLDENALTIGFARRFAAYKRATLLFTDPRRLARLLSGDPDRPVQVVFAGKAHPMDKEGLELVRRVYAFTRRAPFRGRVHFVENYDIYVGRLLTQGCDLWLNTPLRPLEASGTSGMKPALNAGLNCSILDGWWPEAFNGRNGWRIGSARALPTRARQDAHDAESLYRTLEERIVPAFYDRDSHGVPRRWTRIAAESLRTIPARFSSHRMVAQYVDETYLPSIGR